MYLSCIVIVVIDWKEEHDAEDRGWQHGQQVRLKAPNILDTPNTRNTKFPQKQIHHLEPGFNPLIQETPHSTNLWIGLQWQPSFLLCHPL